MGKTVCAVLLAAGGSTRMGADENGRPINKMLIDLCGRTPIEHCVLRFSAFADEIVIAASRSTEQAALKAAKLVSVPVKVIMGGSLRQDSVLNGIRNTGCDIVAIHDCARCAVGGDVILRAIESAKLFGSGVPAVKVTDTLRRESDGETVDRTGLVRMQTPQCFDRERLLKAYENAPEVTDDAAIWRNEYGPVRLTRGSIENEKLTEAEDVEFFRKLCCNTDNGPAIERGYDNMRLRIGIGEDTHRLTEGRDLILGGVKIPFRLGLLGHSDADALVHAIMDALLGAAALGDIGRYFSDKDPRYEGISSLILLERVMEMLKDKDAEVVNVDAVITAQEPKLAPFIDKMRKTIADAIGVGIDSVGLKATTPEHLGPEGNLECITVRAVACIGLNR